MGKIYCIIGSNQDINCKIKEIILGLSKEYEFIILNDGNQDSEYNIYIKDYIISTSPDKLKDIYDKYEGSIVPIYINDCIKNNIETEKEELLKTYDSTDMAKCVKEILEYEFGFYKEYEPIINVSDEDKPGKPTINGENKGQIEKRKSPLFRTKKKYFLVASIFVLVSCIALFFLTAEEGNIDNCYSNKNIKIYSIFDLGTSPAYIIDSSGNANTVEGYRLLNTSVDRKSAIISTIKDEIYLVKENIFEKISDNVITSQISNYGEYVFFISEGDDGKFILNKYNTNDKSIKILSDSIEKPEGNHKFNIVVSPDGMNIALIIYSPGYYDYSKGYDMIIFNNGKSYFYSGIYNIAGISDEGTVYFTDSNNNFNEMSMENDTYKPANKVVEEYSSISSIFINKNYTEILCFTDKGTYLYDVNKKHSVYLLDKNLSIIQNHNPYSLSYSGYNTINTIKSKNNAEESGGFYGVIDISSFKNIYFTPLNNGSDLNVVYRLDKRNNLYKLYEYNWANELEFISQDGNNLFIYEYESKSIYKISPSGTKKLLFSGMDFAAKEIVRVSNNGAVYYFDENDYLCYVKDNVKKEIERMRIPEDSSISQGMYIALNYDNDVLYFINDNRLLSSKEGDTPSVITENNSFDIIFLEENKTGIFYHEANYIDKSDENSEVNIDTYKIFDNGKKELILNFNFSIGLMETLNRFQDDADRMY